jgi:hypothetical protein
MPIAIVFPQPAYPNRDTGYADVDAVARNINAGSWDPSMPNAFPTVNQVESWLVEAAAMIDSELAARGYTIPLTVSSGYVIPAGMQPMNGLHPYAYVLLQNCASHYACAMLEQARHGSISQNEDPDAKMHHQLFDDYINRLASGADNLTAFGAIGPFPPQLDPASGEQTGTMGAFLSTNTQPDPTQEGARFTNGTMQF